MDSSPAKVMSTRRGYRLSRTALVVALPAALVVQTWGSIKDWRSQFLRQPLSATLGQPIDYAGASWTVTRITRLAEVRETPSSSPNSKLSQLTRRRSAPFHARCGFPTEAVANGSQPYLPIRWSGSNIRRPSNGPCVAAWRSRRPSPASRHGWLPAFRFRLRRAASRYGSPSTRRCRTISASASRGPDATCFASHDDCSLEHGCKQRDSDCVEQDSSVEFAWAADEQADGVC